MAPLRPFSRKTRAGIASEQGFSLIEALITASIALAIMLALASFFTFAQKENLAVTQKLEALDFQRQLGQVMSDEVVCSSNMGTSGLSISPVPGATPDPSGRTPKQTGEIPVLYSNKDLTQKLAEAGKYLPSSRSKVPVLRIRVTDLFATTTPHPVTGELEYTGSIEVVFGDLPATPPQKDLIRAIQPARTTKKFYGTSSKINSCSSNSIATFVASGPWVVNDLTQENKSVVMCPPGWKAVGGGWYNEPWGGASPPAGCGAQTAAAMLNNPTPDGNGWEVTVLCYKFKAKVVCFKPQ